MNSLNNIYFLLSCGGLMINKKMINVTLEIFNKRKVFYISSYIVGCFGTGLTMLNGKPWYFALINVNSIFFCITAGNSLYFTYIKTPLHVTFFKIIKYTFRFILFILILNLLAFILRYFSIDILYFIY